MQAFLVAGPIRSSFPGAGSVTVRDSLAARVEACLFPVRRRPAVDACWFVEQTSGLCRARAAHVEGLSPAGSWTVPLAGPEGAPRPSPCLREGCSHCSLGRRSVLPTPLDFSHSLLPAATQLRHNLLKHMPPVLRVLAPHQPFPRLPGPAQWSADTLSGLSGPFPRR